MIKTATGHWILNPEKYKGWKKKRVITELSIINEEEIKEESMKEEISPSSCSSSSSSSSSENVSSIYEKLTNLELKPKIINTY